MLMVTTILAPTPKLENVRRVSRSPFSSSSSALNLNSQIQDVVLSLNVTSNTITRNRHGNEATSKAIYLIESEKAYMNSLPRLLVFCFAGRRVDPRAQLSSMVHSRVSFQVLLPVHLLLLRALQYVIDEWRDLPLPYRPVSAQATGEPTIILRLYFEYGSPKCLLIYHLDGESFIRDLILIYS